MPLNEQSNVERNIIGWLDDAQLAEYRESFARCAVVTAGISPADPGFEDAVAIYLNDYAMSKRMREELGVDEELSIAVSVIDGAVMQPEDSTQEI